MIFFFFPMEEEEGIIYLKMTGTFLAWGHYSTCARARSRVRALTRSLVLLKTYSFFFFLNSHQISNLRYLSLASVPKP